jgi:molybdopterin-guanine dinucleotide biosynthesis protein A
LNAAPLYGLILAGGASSRMQRDKAALQYQGRSQLDRAFELATRHVSKVFVSVRANQQHDPVRSAKPMIVDSVAGEGPIVGIRSALAAHPHAAWLVLACDLPFLSDAVLEHLLAGRDPNALATAYRSAHAGLLDVYQSGGGRCPRKFLIGHGARLLDPIDEHALDNVNTPEEYAQARQALEGA